MGEPRLREAPPPVQVRMVTITWVGMALWGAGLVVTGPLALADRLVPLVPATCLAGLILGVPTWWWARRR
jgi:hypothetical protein